MSMPDIAIFGEVLFDCFPNGERVLGGAPFNVAWHLHALAQNTHFISRVGCDADGRAIAQAMLSWGMPIADIQSDVQYATGTVQVSFAKGEPCYAILTNQAYDFIDATLLPVQHYAVIYHGTLALRQAISAQAFAVLAEHSGKRFFDVNLRAPWWQRATVEKYLLHTDWLKLNAEELAQWQHQGETLSDTMQRLLTHYGLAVIVVTRGAQGAVALNCAGELIDITPSDTVTVVDTVGAGDAFAAVLLLGLQHGWTLATTMQRAQDFASALVGRRGATVADSNFYTPFRQLWQL